MARLLWRQYTVLGLLLAMFALVGLHVVQLQLEQHEHLRVQGAARYLRAVTVLPQRGRILDRNGQVLSVSTPVESVWSDPAQFCRVPEQWPPLLALLATDEAAPAARLQQACARHQQSDFMYIKRRLAPARAAEIMALQIPGVAVQTEYKRYYPGGPAGAHLIGFSNVDGVGQEGLEAYFNPQLSGQAGRKRMLKDLHGRYVEDVEQLKPVEHGEDLVISIDQRAQLLASVYLESAVRQHQAVGGSVVVLAIPSGEIIALVNSPQFNPNDRRTLIRGVFRNRAMADLAEPGSTVKPFTIAMALESGSMNAQTVIDTAPGRYPIGGHSIRDVRNFGAITLSDVLAKSSNVGAAKIAQAFPPDALYQTLQQAGFGQPVLELPGEATGSLVRRERLIEQVTLSYGYGFSVTPLQLARAYTAFATDGVVLPVTLERKPAGYAADGGQRLFDQQTVAQVRSMLERAASPVGTAGKAAVARYRVGGKTGTTHKLIDGNYQNHRYQSVFAGIAPLTEPRFVAVVMVDDPRGEHYYGGEVAAPVFSALMADLLRLYNVRPDGLEQPAIEMAETPEAGI